MDIALAVDKAKAGSKEAFTYLYETTYEQNCYVAQKYMNSENKASDVLQIAYLKAFQNIKKLNDPSKFVQWMSRIVATVAISEIHKESPTLFAEAIMGDFYDFDDTYDYGIKASESNIALNIKEVTRYVSEIVSELTDGQRICICMFFLEKLSIKEMARMLKVSEGVIANTLGSSRQAIISKIETYANKGKNLFGLEPFDFFLLLLNREFEEYKCRVPKAKDDLAKYTAKKSISIHIDASIKEKLFKMMSKLLVAAIIVGAVAIVVVNRKEIVQSIHDQGITRIAANIKESAKDFNKKEDETKSDVKEETDTQDSIDNTQVAVPEEKTIDEVEAPKLSNWQETGKSGYEGDGSIYAIKWEPVEGADAFEIFMVKYEAYQDDTGNIIVPEYTNSLNEAGETVEVPNNIEVHEIVESTEYEAGFGENGTYATIQVRSIHNNPDGTQKYSDWSKMKSLTHRLQVR